MRIPDLWDAFEAEYQPQTRTEWTYLESMVASQWLLVRNAASEQEVYARTNSLGDTKSSCWAGSTNSARNSNAPSVTLSPI